MDCINRLKELREEENKSIKQLSESLKMPYQTYRNYEIEKRNPTKEVWEHLANHFGVSVPYIMGISSIRNDEEIKDFKVLEILEGNNPQMYRAGVAVGKIGDKNFFTNFTVSLSFENELNNLSEAELIKIDINQENENSPFMDKLKSLIGIKLKNHDFIMLFNLMDDNIVVELVAQIIDMLKINTFKFSEYYAKEPDTLNIFVQTYKPWELRRYSLRFNKVNKKVYLAPYFSKE